MRSRRADLKRRVNGNAHYRTGRQEVTSHAGLELVREYLKRSGFVAILRRAVGSGFPATDFGAVPMILVLLGLILVGGRRILHLRHEQGDPVLARFAGLSRLPAPRTASAWMQRIRSEDVERLSKLNEELVGNVLRRTGGRRLTLDVDGSVVSTGLKVKGAFRGYNPHRRKAPSYYPVTACEAQEGQIVRLRNRPGNIHDGKAAVGFIDDLIRQVRDAVGKRRILELRMDGAFFREDLLDVLDPAGVEYAIKAPFYPWLDFKQIAARAHWKRVDDRTWCYETRQTLWGRVRRIVLYRRHVAHETRKNFQLDLFDPDDATTSTRPSSPTSAFRAVPCGTSTTAGAATRRSTANSREASPSTACPASKSTPTPPGRCSACSPSTSPEPSRPKLSPRPGTPTASAARAADSRASTPSATSSSDEPPSC